MQKQLIKLANHLDRIGLTKEANYLDNIIKKYSDTDDIEYGLTRKYRESGALEGTTLYRGKSWKDLGDHLQAGNEPGSLIELKRKFKFKVVTTPPRSVRYPEGSSDEEGRGRHYPEQTWYVAIVSPVGDPSQAKPTAKDLNGNNKHYFYPDSERKDDLSNLPSSQEFPLQR